MKKDKVHVLTIVAGLILALAVIFSHVLQFQKTSRAQAKTEQQTKEAGDEFAYVSAPTITPPSSAHVQPNLVAHCIFEITQPEEERTTFTSTFCLHPQKLMFTLFRTLISPNAP